MSLTVQPFADLPQLDAVRDDLFNNVSNLERAGSLGLGIGLVILGISRRSLGGGLLALAGAGFVARGATGHCALYRKLGINSCQLNMETGVPGNKGIKTTQSIDVRRRPGDVYGYWRKLENLPRFMEHLESVEEIDAEHSRWVVRGPLGQQLQWQARIVNEREGEMIAWESLPGAEVSNAGSVWFEEIDGGTRIKVSLQYQPPAGAVGAAVAKLFGESPKEQLATDLRTLKEILEKDATSGFAV